MSPRLNCRARRRLRDVSAVKPSRVLIVLLLASAVAPAAVRAQAPVPVAGESVVIAPVDGNVSAKCAGDSGFVALTAPRLIPVGCQVDTRSGTVALTSDAGGGTTQTANFWEGLFTVTQGKDAGAFTTLTLGGARECSGGRSAASAAKKGKRRGRGLWGRGKGKFKTVGRRGAASVRGTYWLTQDLCHDATKVTVKEGIVDVDDFVKNTTVRVKAGQSYTAIKPGLSGPRTVKIGKLVTFSAQGLSGTLSVLMQPYENRGGNGFYATAGRTFRAGRDGSTTIRFRWPTTYKGCAGANNCVALRWRSGGKAVMSVCDNRTTCLRKTVTLRR
jgi:hypothetical protein